MKRAALGATLSVRQLASPVFVIGALLGACLLPVLSTAQESRGVIEGRVFNAATGHALVNARVTLEGTSREAITDESGSFRFAGVPAGQTRLHVFYLGMARQSASVNVPAGGQVEKEFDLALEGAAAAAAPGGPVKLDAFSVVVDREMSAQAISMNEQRHAPNIKNVVAIDEFGDRGSENIGEFLLFLPGVSIETSGAEPTTVSLRGFPGNNSGLTLDGAELAGSFAGNSRSLELREVAMNNISRVEVTKVPTPDMPASGLGGSINLISRSGFEARKPQLSFNAYTMFHSKNGLTFDGGPRNHVKGSSPDFIQPSFDFNYLHPLNKKFAVTVGGGRTWRHKPMEGGTKETDETATWNLVNLYQRQSQWNSLAQTFRTLQGQIGFDWRISSKDTVSASVQYRDYENYTTRSVLAFNYGAGATGDARHTQGAATGVGTATMNGSGDNRDRLTENKSYTLKYRHRGDVWRIDLAGSYSSSNSDNPDIDEGFFRTIPATISNLVIRGDDIPSSGGIIPTRYSATSRTGQPVDLYDGANYAIVSGDSAQHDLNSQRFTTRADLARHFNLGLPFSVKVGAAIDTMKRDQRSFPRLWNFRPNGATDVASRLAGRFDVFDEAFIAGSPTVYSRRVRWISPSKLYDLFTQQPSWFVEDLAVSHQGYVTNSREFTETISAGYIRGDARLLDHRLWVVAGARYERTDAEGRGPLDDINAQYQRNPDGSFVRNAAGQRMLITTDPLALRKLRYVERGAHSKRNYGGIYPSVNATYDVSDRLVVRAAFARTLGRPNINFIIPGTTVSEPDVTDPTITVNNIALQPWTATSYDLSLESYHLKDGFGSIGVFKKSIKNFFGGVRTRATPELLALYGLGTDPVLLDYDISTSTNAGDANINGIEFGYRQSLTFLPRWARGLQVFVNATKLDISGSNTADFTGYNPESFAGGINLVRERFSIKGTVSYLGDVRRGAVGVSAANGIPPNTFNYQAKRTRIGVNAQYSVTKNYSAYVSVVDLGGFVQDQQRYAPDTPDYAKGARWQELGFFTNIGIRGTF
jgi:TonB-dependent receptor